MVIGAFQQDGVREHIAQPQIDTYRGSGIGKPFLISGVNYIIIHMHHYPDLPGPLF
ncbi:hypothetical protein D3C87_1929900 [compost metagenome]